MVWNWFIVKIIYFEAIQNDIKLNSDLVLKRGMSSNLWWLRSTNHVKFTEECVMCIEKKHVFIKKFFKKSLQMGKRWVCDKKPSRNTLTMENRKFQVQQSVKKVMLTF